MREKSKREMKRKDAQMHSSDGDQCRHVTVCDSPIREVSTGAVGWCSWVECVIVYAVEYQYHTSWSV